MARKKSQELNNAEPARIRFIEPMYALAVKGLPKGEEWLYEVKLDGYRALAGRDESGVTLWPEIVFSLA
jgi:ATP-dependent DNA ligase